MSVMPKTATEKARRKLAPTAPARDADAGLRLNYVSQLLLTSLPLLISDILTSGIAAVTAYYVLGISAVTTSTWLLAIVSVPILLAFSGVYPAATMNPIREARSCFFGTLLAWTLAALGSIIQTPTSTAVPYLILCGCLAAILCPTMRTLVRRHCARYQWWGLRLLVVGSSDNVQTKQQWEALYRRRDRGIVPLKMLHKELAKSERNAEHPFNQTFTEQKAYGFIHLPVAPTTEPTQTESRNSQATTSTALTTSPAEVFDYSNIRFDWRQDTTLAKLVKRLFDLVALAIASPLIIPVVITLGLIVRLTSTGPIFYRGDRIGYGGKRFWQWKFRTMVIDADEVLERRLAAAPELREEWDATQKLRNDPRVTRIGRVLRALSLDELPQVWNVIIGDMSLVGPRPITTREISKYENQFEIYKQALPGLTGLWQVSGRSDTTYTQRVALDIHYIRNWSPWFDAYLLFKTIGVVVLKTGAY